MEFETETKTAAWDTGCRREKKWPWLEGAGRGPFNHKPQSASLLGCCRRWYEKCVTKREPRGGRVVPLQCGHAQPTSAGTVMPSETQECFRAVVKFAVLR